MARAQRRNSSRPSQASQPARLSVLKKFGGDSGKRKKNLINFSLHTAAVGTILPLLNYKLWVQNGRKAEKFSSRFWLVPGTSFCASVVRAFNGPPEVMSDFLVSSFICTRNAIARYTFADRIAFLWQFLLFGSWHKNTDGWFCFLFEGGLNWLLISFSRFRRDSWTNFYVDPRKKEVGHHANKWFRWTATLQNRTIEVRSLWDVINMEQYSQCKLWSDLQKTLRVHNYHNYSSCSARLELLFAQRGQPETPNRARAEGGPQ